MYEGLQVAQLEQELLSIMNFSRVPVPDGSDAQSTEYVGRKAEYETVRAQRGKLCGSSHLWIT